MVANFYRLQARGVTFNDIAGWSLGYVGKPPGFGDNRVYDFTGIIDPEYPQIEKDKEHMDGGIDPIVPFFYKHQAIIFIQFLTKRKAA